MPYLLAAIWLPLMAAALLAPKANATDADREHLRRLIVANVRPDSGEKATEAATNVSDRVRNWLRANAAALHGVRRSPLGDQPWGLSSHRPGLAPDDPARVYLYVFDWHAGGKLVVYGLAGGVRKACLLADATQAALPATRVGSCTVLTVPRNPPDALASVVVLELMGADPDVVEIVARPAAGDGRIHLHARDAIIHGVKLRYEPEPNKDTLGYWTETTDWARWDFEVTEPGAYFVEILQGCGKGSGGSTVHFRVGEQVLPVVVEDTGGFQNFVARRVGKFRFPKPGRYTVSVKPVRKAGKAVMDLRSVTLTGEK